jgi:hypothetical protein
MRNPRRDWTIVVLIVFVLLFLYMLVTILQLQADHTTMCSNVANTIDANYRAWGCG